MAPSFMDKARAAAQQAMTEAKKGIDQGQAKLDGAQAKRQADKLLTALGAAFYAEQRQDGSREAVNEALSAVDAHVEANGLAGFPGEEEDAAPAPAPPPPAPAPAPMPAPAPAPAPMPTAPDAGAPPAPPAAASPYDTPPG